MKTLVAIAAISSIAFASASARPRASQDPTSGTRPTGQKERLGTLSCEVAAASGSCSALAKTSAASSSREPVRREIYGQHRQARHRYRRDEQILPEMGGLYAERQQVRRPSACGTYVGVSASGTVGVAWVANALVGGTSKNFGLQPLSAEAIQAECRRRRQPSGTDRHEIGRIQPPNTSQIDKAGQSPALFLRQRRRLRQEHVPGQNFIMSIWSG